MNPRVGKSKHSPQQASQLGNMQEEDDSSEVDPMGMERPLVKPQEMDCRREAASEGVGEVAWGSRVG